MTKQIEDYPELMEWAKSKIKHVWNLENYNNYNFSKSDVEEKLLSMQSKIDSLTEQNKELQERNQWISVDDRLPDEIFDWVLAYSDGAISTIGYSKEVGFYCPYPTSTQLVVEGISHWMPIPELNKESK